MTKLLMRRFSPQLLFREGHWSRPLNRDFVTIASDWPGEGACSAPIGPRPYPRTGSHLGSLPYCTGIHIHTGHTHHDTHPTPTQQAIHTQYTPYIHSHTLHSPHSRHTHNTHTPQTPICHSHHSAPTHTHTHSHTPPS